MLQSPVADVPSPKYHVITPPPEAVQPVNVAVNVNVVPMLPLPGVTVAYPVGMNQVPLLQGSVIKGLIPRAVGMPKMMAMVSNPRTKRWLAWKCVTLIGGSR